MAPIVPLYLADKSAHAQRNHSDQAAERLDRDIAAGRIAVTGQPTEWIVPRGAGG